MHVCVCMHVYTYVCICVCRHTSVCVCTSTLVLCACMHVCVCMCMRVRYVCSVHMFVHMLANLPLRLFMCVKKHYHHGPFVNTRVVLICDYSRVQKKVNLIVTIVCDNGIIMITVTVTMEK